MLLRGLRGSAPLRVAVHQVERKVEVEIEFESERRVDLEDLSENEFVLSYG